MKMARIRLALSDALRVKSAELWLKLGEPVQALLELQHLPLEARAHPWAMRVLRCAYQAGPVRMEK